MKANSGIHVFKLSFINLRGCGCPPADSCPLINKHGTTVGLVADGASTLPLAPPGTLAWLPNRCAAGVATAALVTPDSKNNKEDGYHTSEERSDIGLPYSAAHCIQIMAA